MKKIKNFLKSNIKTVIAFILGIILSGTTVYAATILLNANQVGFNKTGTTLTSTNVQGALEELNEKAKRCPDTKFKLGEYFSLTPTASSFTIKAATTGYTSDQTINPRELTLWRVIDIHSDGSVDAVSEYVSSTDVAFKGITGYANFVGGLQTIAAAYAKTNYTIATRIMGYGGQTSTIVNTSAFDGSSTTAPSTTATASPTSGVGQEYSGGILGDTLYLKDYQLVSSVYGSTGLKTYKVGTTTVTSYWLASRRYTYGTAFGFSGRYVTISSLTNYNFRYCYLDNGRWNGSGTDSFSNALRPIITLKSGVSISGGSGTKSSPYTLS